MGSNFSCRLKCSRNSLCVFFSIIHINVVQNPRFICRYLFAKLTIVNHRWRKLGVSRRLHAIGRIVRWWTVIRRLDWNALRASASRQDGYRQTNHADAVSGTCDPRHWRPLRPKSIVVIVANIIIDDSSRANKCSAFRHLSAAPAEFTPALAGAFPPYDARFACSSRHQASRVQATDQAWAGQPRGVCGGSPSKISLTWPRPASSRWSPIGSSQR